MTITSGTINQSFVNVGGVGGMNGFSADLIALVGDWGGTGDRWAENLTIG